jgi:hypothetical protein
LARRLTAIFGNGVRGTRFGFLTPPARTIKLSEQRHGNTIRAFFQIDPAALTAEQGRYIFGFRKADEIRNRSFAAKQDSDRRPRASASDRLGSQAA